MKKRQKTALETRRKLLEAGEKLIVEKGFDNISVEDITQACGVAKGTFYVYFKRKEDIVQEISRGPFYRIEDDLFQMRDCDSTEKLRHYFSQFMIGVERYDINICRQWIKNVIDPNQAPASADSQKLDYDIKTLERILEKEIADGRLIPETPVDALTHLIICELYGMMTCWCMSDGVFEPRDWVDTFCDLQLKTLLARYQSKP